MRYFVYQDTDGYWRWRLLAANNRILADSGEGYVNKMDCLRALGMVKHSALAQIKLV